MPILCKMSFHEICSSTERRKKEREFIWGLGKGAKESMPIFLQSFLCPQPFLKEKTLSYRELVQAFNISYKRCKNPIYPGKKSSRMFRGYFVPVSTTSVCQCVRLPQHKIGTCQIRPSVTEVCDNEDNIPTNVIQMDVWVGEKRQVCPFLWGESVQ